MSKRPPRTRGTTVGYDTPVPGGGSGQSGRAWSPPSDPIDESRLAIDTIDARLVDLLNLRATHAVEIGRLKRVGQLAVYQPSREEQVLANVQRCNRGPLENGALRRLFERIIDESRRLERLATATEPQDHERTEGEPTLPDDATD